MGSWEIATVKAGSGNVLREFARAQRGSLPRGGSTASVDSELAQAIKRRSTNSLPDIATDTTPSSTSTGASPTFLDNGQRCEMHSIGTPKRNNGPMVIPLDGMATLWSQRLSLTPGIMPWQAAQILYNTSPRPGTRSSDNTEDVFAVELLQGQMVNIELQSISFADESFVAECVAKALGIRLPRCRAAVGLAADEILHAMDALQVTRATAQQ